MSLKGKGQSHIKMHFNHHISKNIGCKALVLSCTTTKSTMWTKCEDNFPDEGQSHRVNEHKA